MFHEFDEKLQRVLTLVAMHDAPVTKRKNDEDLQLQAEARREKELLAQKKTMEKVSDTYIEAQCLINLYHSE